MKIFKTMQEAVESMEQKDKIFLNSECPYDSLGRVCGNWCAVFYYYEGDERTSPMVILGCKAGEKNLYVSN